MNLELCSLASGSSGNCYVIRSEKGCLLIDAGISARQICRGLEALGSDATQLDAVLVTHEHSDHVKGLPVFSRRTEAGLYGTAATLSSIGGSVELPRHMISAGDFFMIADMKVTSFALSHDAADPVGYSVSCGGVTITVVTDTGIVTDAILQCMGESDILVLESNHDENILRVGNYPYFLKQRILGDKGHLSNETAAKALARVLSDEKKRGCLRKRQILLAHLSKENNFPEMALATMENVLEEKGVAPGNQIQVSVLPRMEISSVYRL